MMLRKALPASSRRRPGTVLPLLALCLVALLGFLALAIDLGMIALAKAQTQNAADLAALSAARSLDATSSDYGQASATTNAQNALGYNAILSKQIQSSQLTLTYGTYDYNQTTQSFSSNFPGTANVPTSAVTATVSSTPSSTAFAGVFGWSALPTVSATATAVHRPRDVALVMDLSTSMRFGTLLGFDFYTSSRSTNNADTVVPNFGHYAQTSVQNAMIGTSSNQTSGASSYTITPTNTTATNSYYAQTYINSFYQQNAYATPIVRAFDSYSSSDGGLTWTAPSSATPQLPASSYATTPGGDMPVYKNGSTSTFAQHVKDITGGTTFNMDWELDGYSNYVNGLPRATKMDASPYSASYPANSFYGYTQGPGYWGKTFFIWPPDPRQPLGTATVSGKTNDTIQIWLQQIGYQNSSGGLGYTTDSGTDMTIQGIYSSVNGGHAWPWPSGDDGTGTVSGTLSNYLVTKVKKTNKSGLLTTTDQTFCRIMRLYYWNYVVDNLGTTACDWRVRFFGTNDNTKLFSSTGLNNPSNYTINYTEILRWIKSSPNPFPTQMRAGRIKYYGSIPDSITGSWPSYGSTDQRFWKEFIDYCLGFYQTGSTTYTDVSRMAGYGSDVTWGTVSKTSPPGSGVNTPYMTYTDIPPRPLLRYWFSPINMVDYLHNCNMYEQGVGNWYQMTPGDGYEAPLYPGKQGFLGAINSMQTNHPNDWFTTIFYSWPRENSTDQKCYNCVSCPLSTNYDYARSSLFFPFSTINADGSCNNTEVTPYDPDPTSAGTSNQVPSLVFNDVPRGNGDTCFDMALMLAYNQFVCTPSTDASSGTSGLRGYTSSTPIAFPTGMAGGMGRKGAQKVIIFETDGIPNCQAGINGSYSAPAQSAMTAAATYLPARYYPIRFDMNKPTSSQYPTINPTYIGDPNVSTNIQKYVTQLKNDFGTQRNPFRLYALGFGPVFDSSSPNYTTATTMLQNMQYWAGTQSSASTALDSSQLITGTDSVMKTNMTNAFTKILQDGIQIALTQ